MLTIPQIKQRLSDANLKRVALNAGLHPATVYRFVNGNGRPLFETVRALSEYLEETVNV
jgi:DNA-binding phage protein